MKRSKRKRQKVRDRARWQELSDKGIGNWTPAESEEMRILTRRMIRELNNRPPNYYVLARRQNLRNIRNGYWDRKGK